MLGRAHVEHRSDQTSATGDGWVAYLAVPLETEPGSYTIKVTVDGAPAAGLEFEIIRGDTRYRNAQEEIKATSDANGHISVTWPSAGMYWVETTSSDAKTSVPQATQRRLSYVVTLEVLPQ